MTQHTPDTTGAAPVTPTADERAKARVAELTSQQIVDALKVLDGQAINRDRVMAYRWMINELEHRYPAASRAVAEAFLAAELEAARTGEPAKDVDYLGVLVANIDLSPRRSPRRSGVEGGRLWRL